MAEVYEKNKNLITTFYSIDGLDDFCNSLEAKEVNEDELL
jgi:hypothetical protein